MRAILDAPTPPPRHAAALAPLIAALLEKDPARRPDAVSAAPLLPAPIAADVAGSRPDTVRLRTGSRPRLRGLRRRPAVVGAAAAVVLAAAVGVTALVLDSGGGRNKVVLGIEIPSSSNRTMLDTARRQSGVVYAAPMAIGADSVLVCVHGDRADQVAAALRRAGATNTTVLSGPDASLPGLPPTVLAVIRGGARACFDGGASPAASASGS
jgi:hypothetical protein